METIRNGLDQSLPKIRLPSFMRLSGGRIVACEIFQDGTVWTAITMTLLGQRRQAVSHITERFDLLIDLFNMRQRQRLHISACAGPVMP
jgi:hypothetical protein